MAIEELLKHVHPEAVYRRTPLPDDQNALGPWREAIKLYVPPDENDSLWASLIYGEEGQSVAFPADAEGDRLREWLDRNQPALELLETGIQRGRLQLPERHGDDIVDLDSDIAIQVAPLFRILFVKAKRSRADGIPAEELQSLVLMLRMGEMICNGDGVVIHYMMGCSRRKSALNGIRRLADCSGTPASVLRGLLAAIEKSIAAPDGFEQSLRADFYYWTLEKLDTVDDRNNIEELVDQILKVFYPNNYISFDSFDSSNEPQVIVPSDDRLEWRRKKIVSLLRGHPRPLDTIATIQQLGKWQAAIIRGSRKPRILDVAFRLRNLLFSACWCHRWSQPRNMKYWPIQLGPRFPVDCLGPSEEARRKLAERCEYLAAKEQQAWQPPTEAEIAVSRRKLQRVYNPIGWMLAAQLAPMDIRPFACEYRKMLQDIRILLVKRLRNGA